MLVNQITSRLSLNFLLTNTHNSASQHMQFNYYSFHSARNYTQRRESLLNAAEIKQQLQTPAGSVPPSAAVVMVELLLFTSPPLPPHSPTPVPRLCFVKTRNSNERKEKEEKEKKKGFSSTTLLLTFAADNGLLA